MKNETLSQSLAARFLFAAITLAAFGVSTQAFAADADWKKGWDRLASRKVELLSEQDEVRLSHQGRLQKLVFEVRKAPVYFKDVKVHLATGAVLDIPIRSVVKEGSRSRVIDLPGEARTVRKIVFTYESLRSKRRGGDLGQERLTLRTQADCCRTLPSMQDENQHQKR